MNDSTDATCATDVVRCLDLARVAQRLGHPKAAGRWLKKAEQWSKTIVQSNGPRGGQSLQSTGRRPAHTPILEEIGAASCWMSRVMRQNNLFLFGNPCKVLLPADGIPLEQ